MKNNKFHIDYAFRTDIGRVRLNNEDRVDIVSNPSGDVLMVVADGMGGHNKGEYASKLAVDFIIKKFKNHRRKFLSIYFAKIWLHTVITKANKLIFNTAENDITAKGMGTTFVIALIHNDKLLVANAGDSRAYMYLAHQLKRLSEDQSYVDYLKRSGQLSDDEAEKREDKNILMSALGVYPSISFNSYVYKYQDEPILLCSDGLFNNLKEKDIANFISKKMSAKEIVSRLIDEANNNGGSDNITVAYFKRSYHG